MNTIEANPQIPLDPHKQQISRDSPASSTVCKSVVLRGRAIIVKDGRQLDDELRAVLDLLQEERDMNLSSVSLVRSFCEQTLFDSIASLRELCMCLKDQGLKEVDCSHCYLGEKGVEAARGLFLGKQIEKLYLGNCSLNGPATFLLCELLLDFCAPPLKTLVFEKNPCGDEGAEALGRLLSQSHSLSSLKVSDVGTSPQSTLHLVQAIGSMTSLRSLDLSRNVFSKDTLRKLADNLRHHTDLQYLSLRGCQLTDRAIIVFLSILAETHLPQLTFLDLSDNDLHVEEIWIDLLSWLKTNAPSLEYLELNGGIRLNGQRCRSL